MPNVPVIHPPLVTGDEKGSSLAQITELFQVNEIVYMKLLEFKHALRKDEKSKQLFALNTSLRRDKSSGQELLPFKVPL